MPGLPSDARVLTVHVDAVGFDHDAWLSEAEKERARSFGSPKRVRQFVAGRVAARHLLADFLAVDPRSVSLKVRPDGSVDVGEDGAGLALSIAHSGSVAAVAARNGPIGVDVEHIRPRRADLFRFVLAAEEYPLLDAMPVERNEAVILCWSIKEAVLKGRRSGLRMSPKRLRLSIDFDGGMASVLSPDGEWSVGFVRVRDYVVSVAWTDG